MIIQAKITDYGRPSDDGYILEAGCLDWLAYVESLPLVFEHRMHLEVGRVTELESRLDGVYGNIKVFDTPPGTYVQQLIEADVLDSFSIGYQFNPKVNRAFERLINGCYRTAYSISEVAKVDEVSIVIMPAYSGAVMNGKKNKKSESVEQTVERLKGCLGITWAWKADEINKIIMEKLKMYREQHWKQIYQY